MYQESIKEIGAQPGEAEKTPFSLPNHITRALEPLQYAEKIAKSFSKIRSEYPALDLKYLPHRVKQRIFLETDDI